MTDRIEQAGTSSTLTGPAADILAAARRCFARHGYRGTSIKKIAAEAGIRSPSILHYHFENKEAIFLAVMRQAMAALAARATEVGMLADGPRGLGAVDAFFRLLDEEGEDLTPLLLECLAVSSRPGATSRDEMAALYQEVEARVEEAVTALLGDAAERLPLSPRVLAATVVDLLTGHAIRSTLRPKGEGTSELRVGILTLLGQLRPLDAAPTDPTTEEG